MIIPFYVGGDGLTHRVSADSHPDWVKQHMFAFISLLTNCGETLMGQIRPDGDRYITCVRCMGVRVPEIWEDD